MATDEEPEQGRGERGQKRPEHVGTGRGRATKTGRQSPEGSRKAQKWLWGQGMKSGFLPSGKGRESGGEGGALVQFHFSRQREASVTSAVGTASLQAPLGKHRACWGPHRPHFPSQNAPYTLRAPRWRGAPPSLCSRPFLSLSRSPRHP